MLPPLIAVSIGNTSTVLAVYPGDGDAAAPSTWPTAARETRRPTTSATASDELSARLAEFFPAGPPDLLRWRVSRVQRAAEERLAEWVRAQRPQDDYRRLTHADLPLAVDVELPDRVGLDRLLSAVGANALRRPEAAAIVVDAGTALTVNLVTADGVFRGGAILPGVGLAARALADGTDFLPLVAEAFADEPPPIVGRRTESAMASGLYFGSLGAVRELAGQIAARADGPVEGFLTGGDGRYLLPAFPGPARYVPDLIQGGIVLSARCEAARLDGYGAGGASPPRVIFRSSQSPPSGQS